MQKSDLIKTISEYLSAHKKMTIATVTADGRPLAHTVEYASEGPVVYFITLRASRKAVNLLGRPDVAYCVDEDDDDWLKIQGVQMTGRAHECLGAEREKAARLMAEKFPIITSYPRPDMPLVKMEQTALFRIEPVEGFFIDNTKGLGNRERVEF